MLSGSVNLSPAVRDVIAAVLYPGTGVNKLFFGHPRLGEVYRSYVISQVLDGVSDLEDPAADLPGRRTAEVLSCYGLTGEGSGNWTQLYEHMGGVVAAAVTIARRMRLSAADMEMTRAAAFLRDAT